MVCMYLNLDISGGGITGRVQNEVEVGARRASIECGYTCNLDGDPVRKRERERKGEAIGEGNRGYSGSKNSASRARANVNESRSCHIPVCHHRDFLPFSLTSSSSSPLLLLLLLISAEYSMPGFSREEPGTGRIAHESTYLAYYNIIPLSRSDLEQGWHASSGYISTRCNSKNRISLSRHIRYAR